MGFGGTKEKMPVTTMDDVVKIEGRLSRINDEIQGLAKSHYEPDPSYYSIINGGINDLIQTHADLTEQLAKRKREILAGGRIH